MGNVDSRTAPVISQVNSLVHAIIGDPDEALRIQHEFAAEKQNRSHHVLGHLIAAGYAAAGQGDKAEEASKAALGNSTVDV